MSALLRNQPATTTAWSLSRDEIASDFQMIGFIESSTPIVKQTPPSAQTPFQQKDTHIGRVAPYAYQPLHMNPPVGIPPSRVPVPRDAKHDRHPAASSMLPPAPVAGPSTAATKAEERTTPKTEAERARVKAERIKNMRAEREARHRQEDQVALTPITLVDPSAGDSSAPSASASRPPSHRPTTVPSPIRAGQRPARTDSSSLQTDATRRASAVGSARSAETSNRSALPPLSPAQQQRTATASPNSFRLAGNAQQPTDAGRAAYYPASNAGQAMLARLQGSPPSLAASDPQQPARPPADSSLHRNHRPWEHTERANANGLGPAYTYTAQATAAPTTTSMTAAASPRTMAPSITSRLTGAPLPASTTAAATHGLGLSVPSSVPVSEPARS